MSMQRKLTIDQAAKLFAVTPKTIRSWVAQGMPTVRSGRKGAGNGAIVDLPRAALWLARKRKLPPVCWAEFLQAHVDSSLRNPLRWAVEEFAAGAIRAIAAGAISWYRDPNTAGKIAWQELGLTDAQARAAVWQLAMHAALSLHSYKLDRFERDISQGGEFCDLDDLATLFFQGEIRSKFRDEIAIPEALHEFRPPAARKLPAGKTSRKRGVTG